MKGPRIHARPTPRDAWTAVLALLPALAFALLMAAAVALQLGRPAALVASETTEEAVQTGETLCQEAPAAAQMGSTISGAASAQASALDALGAVTGAAGLDASSVGPPLPVELRPIMPFSKASTYTKGKEGLIQAHHILEQRHVKAWGLEAGKSAAVIEKELADGPSVILEDWEHKLADAELRGRMPCGKVYSKATVWSNYLEVYKNYPQWLEAIAPFFA
jgi:hypothetical protein